MQITENVFTQETLDKLHNFSRGGKQPTKTNFFSYLPEIVGVSNAIFGFDLDDEFKKTVFKELVNKNILPSTPKKSQAYIQLFSRNSFVPWHGDDKYLFTVTVYLNKEWDINFGGLFIYEENKELKCLLPKYNTAVNFIPPMGHTTSATNINATLRESLQIFVEEF
jgi:hypothetical protein